MPIRSIDRLYDTANPPNEIGIRLNGVGAGGMLEVLYADIPGGTWDQSRLDAFVLAAQNKIDQRVNKNTLPANDPARLADPGLPNFFWDGNQIVARPVVISDVSWDGSRLNFRLTRNY